MQTDLQEQIFGVIDGEDSYIFIPTDEAVRAFAEAYEIGLEELKRISESLGLMYNLVAPKDNLVDGILKLQSGVEMPFDIETLELDGLEVLDSYEENSNTYIILNGFPISARQDDNILTEVQKITRTTRMFKRLDRGVLERILAESSPEDIARLCQTDKKFQALCNDPKTFRRLLDKYYPKAVYTNDPRKQFIAIASGIKTFYRMKAQNEVGELIVPGHDGVYRHYFDDVEQMHEPSRIEDMKGWSIEKLPRAIDGEEGVRQEIWNYRKDPQIAIEGLPGEYHDNLPHGEHVIFYVDGLSIPPGQTLFLLMDTGSEMIYDAEVYKTREELAENYSENYGRFLSDLIDGFLDSNEDADELVHEDNPELHEDFGRLTGEQQLDMLRRLGLEEKFNTYISEMGVRMPFTKESLRQQALHDENLYIHPNTYHSQHQVIEVTF